MDRYEYRIKLDEIENLYNSGYFEEASQLADTINWRKTKNPTSLALAAEVYHQVHRYEQCKEVLLLAYEKSVQGKSKKVMFRMCMIAIESGEFDDALEFYNEFAALAPHDSGRYELKFYLSRAKKEPLSEQIKAMELLKDHDFNPEWMYKLAYLYHEAGMVRQCVDTCNELVLYFQDGDYVIEALKLKSNYEPLSIDHEILLQDLLKRKQGIVEVRPGERLGSGEIVTQVVDIPEVKYDPTRYNTINLQQELAKGMQQIRSAESKEQVASALDSIHKAMGENPVVASKITDQLPSAAEYDRQYASEKEIDGSFSTVYNQLMAESEANQPVSQNPMDMSEIMGDWGRQNQVAAQTFQEIENRKLETARARALHETGDMLNQLTQINRAEAEAIMQRAQANPTPENMAAAAAAMEELNKRLQAQIEAMSANQQASQPSVDTYQQAEAPATDRMAMAQLTGNLPQTKVTQDTLTQRDFRGYSADYSKVVKPEIPEPTPEFIEAEPIPEASEIFDRVSTGDTGSFEEIIGKWSDFRQTDASADERKAKQEEEIMDSVGEINIEDEIAAEMEKELANQETTKVEEILPEIDMNIFGDDTPGWTEPTRQATAPIPNVLETQATAPLPDIKVASAVTEPMPEPEMIKEPESEPVTMPTPEQIVSQATTILPDREAIGQMQESVPDPVQLSNTQVIRQSTKPMERLERSALISGYHGGHIERLTPELAAGFSYFTAIDGMDKQICAALNTMSDYITGETPIGGNLVITGCQGSGKTKMAENMIRTLQVMIGKPGKQIAKIGGNKLNNKDIAALLDKLQGKSLIVEEASLISVQTATEIVRYMNDKSNGVLLILEDEKPLMDRMFAQNQSFMHLFGAAISIPIFTDHELAEFAKAYAHENGYEMDNMAELALHTKINTLQKIDQAATISQVKELIDNAIYNAERPGLRKIFGTITSKRYTAEDYVIIREKDFE